MVFAIPLAAIIGGTFVSIIKILKGNGAGKRKRLDADETRMMQEIFQGLERMEKRIETLETLLLEREGRDKI